MSFFIGNNYCDKCGKPLGIFEQGLCAECEKKVLLDEPNTVVGCIPTIEAYKQVCKERDIAIEQLHELGYEFGQKIEPCDDVVSRQAVLDINESHHGQMPNHINHQIWQEIKELPSVRPQEPKPGHWIEDEYEMVVRCSECGEENEECSKYCPNCGAKMVEPQERSDKE